MAKKEKIKGERLTVKKIKEVEFYPNRLVLARLTSIGKGLHVKRLESASKGTIIEVYKRHFNVNPKKTLAGIVFFSVLLGIFIGALLW